ncbi:DUF502 domain-containing protein [bacterium]|nr:DUF502 domain-containing protein [bacterium]MBR2273884.1 DUF502 domain-containing protein [Alphaproteobacteria bacterium]
MKKSKIKKLRQTIEEKRKPSFFGYVISKLKTYLFTGILVTTPVSITFYMAYELFMWIDKLSRSLIPPKVISREFLPYIPGVGVAILIGALIIIGMFTTGFIGRFFVRLGDFIVSKIPLISSLYSLLKQLFETVLSPKSQSFKEAVLLEYPRKGIWIIGFLAGETTGELKEKLPHTKMLSIFIPTTPNPTSGFLITVPASDTIKLDMSVEDALKYVVSCGIVLPEDEQKKLSHKKH